MFCLIISPMDGAFAQPSGYNCPNDAMTVALSLSMQVNQKHLPNLNSSSTDQDIATQINKLDPIIDASPLGLTLPPLNGSSVKPFSVLATPYDNFVNASAAVNSSDPDSACNFLGDTSILVADVTVIAVGTITVTVGAALFTVAGQYCPSSCFLNFANGVGNFISANGSKAAGDAWNAAYSLYCAIPGRCPATTSTTAPEFPSQYIGALVFISLAAIALLTGRQRLRKSPSPKCLPVGL